MMCHSFFKPYNTVLMCSSHISEVSHSALDTVPVSIGSPPRARRPPRVAALALHIHNP